MTAPTAAPRFDLDIEGVERPERAQALLDAVRTRVVIADGAVRAHLSDPSTDELVATLRGER